MWTSRLKGQTEQQPGTSPSPAKQLKRPPLRGPRPASLVASSEQTLGYPPLSGQPRRAPGALRSFPTAPAPRAGRLAATMFKRIFGATTGPAAASSSSSSSAGPKKSALSGTLEVLEQLNEARAMTETARAARAAAEAAVGDTSSSTPDVCLASAALVACESG